MSRFIPLQRNTKQKSRFNVVLERALGFTALNNCSVALDTKNSTLFYVAGCVVVGETLHDNDQFIIQSLAKKSLTCLDVSADGKYIITGESGHQPMVRVWNRADGTQIGAMGSHHFRISAVLFSPGSVTHIVSVGCQEDQMICVWDRTKLQKVASAKVSGRVNAVAFSEDGEFFVTVGIRHIRFWYIDLKKRSKIKETQPLKGRNAVLGDMLHNTFSDVCCCTGQVETGTLPQTLTLVLSQAGQLLQINAARCVAKWVDLKVTSAACMALSRQTVVVGCSSGACLLFSAITLRFLARVPLPHQLGAVISSSKIGTMPSHSAWYREEKRYAEVIATKLDLSAGHLVCFYADHSVYCWNVKDLRSITRRFAHFYHSRAVCGGAVTGGASSAAGGGGGGSAGAEGGGTDSPDLGRWGAANSEAAPTRFEHLVTCSDDDTLRVWTFPVCRSTIKAQKLFPNGKEVVSVLYTDATYANLCCDERTNGFGPSYFGQGSTLNLSTPGSPSPLRQHSATRWGSNGSLLSTSVHASSPSAAPTPPALGGGGGGFGAVGAGIGLRTLAISPDGKHIAVGDRIGQLRIYDFNTFKLLHSIPAHDAEILSITYFDSTLVEGGMSLVCTSSRDRVIHVFAPRAEYSRVQTLADHSGAVHAALFLEAPDSRRLYLVSCGTDRSLLFRLLCIDPESQTARFVIEHHVSVTHSYACATVVGPSLLGPAALPVPGTDSGGGAMRTRVRCYLAVACQDRQLRLYQVGRSPRQLFHYRASTSEDGSPVCCAADPTSTLIAIAGSDKQISVFFLFTGELVATLCGHADSVLGLVWLPDLRHLVSLGCDSCVFVWRLAPELTAVMLDRQHRSAAPSLDSSPRKPSPGLPLTCKISLDESTKFCGSEADLPLWARGRKSESDTEASSECSRVSGGRKVQRASTVIVKPVAAAAAAIRPPASPLSERSRLSLPLKRHRASGAAALQPLDLGRCRGRSSSSLSCLSAASTTTPTSAKTPRGRGGDGEDLMTTSTASVSDFPQWASSVIDISTAESPFEPPPLMLPPTSRNDLKNKGAFSLTNSLSTEALSTITIDDHPLKNANGDRMTRSQIDEYCPRLSRVEEMDELARRPSLVQSKQPISERVNWLPGPNSSGHVIESEDSAACTTLIRPSRFDFRNGSNQSTSPKDFESSSNPVSSTSECASVLSLLSNLRNALDAAVNHLVSSASDADNALLLSEGREYFLAHLESRVERLRDLLHVNSTLESPSPSSSAAAASAQTSPAATPPPRETAAVEELIERLMPSIRSAVTETLIGAGGGEVSADLLPAE